MSDGRIAKFLLIFVLTSSGFALSATSNILLLSSTKPNVATKPRSKLADSVPNDEDGSAFGSLVPIRYDLRLVLNSSLDTAIGYVAIEFECRVNATKKFTLHASPAHLYIERAVLEQRYVDNSSVVLASPTVDGRLELVKFELQASLKLAHIYRLGIWYRANFGSDGKGLVKSSNNKSGLWVNTLFEPTYARRLFPSFDEPRWRAIFRLEVVLHEAFADPSYVALSNTNGASERHNESSTVWYFEPTPPIPTYLFTLAVGRFRNVCSEATPKRPEICIWRFDSRSNWEQMAHQIIAATAKFQQSMVDYLQSNPVARLHLLLVPFDYNGMENFGLLNIKETLWPLENDTNSFPRFLRTLHHELTHQWFGNLVTLCSWEHIWLGEAFATFFSLKRPILYNPTHDLSTEPLIAFNWTNGRIPLMTYIKGSMVVEMLASILGEQSFRKLLRDYFRTFEFQCANTQHFFEIINTSLSSTERSHQVANCAGFLASWLHRGSHPIVFIHYDAVQQQFHLSQTAKVKAESNTNDGWLIPIWVECLDGSVGEKLYWIPQIGGLSLNLSDLTSTGDEKKVAFNRNKGTYYELSLH